MEILLEDETQLIQLVQNGDKTAFRELVEKHKRNVYYLAFDLTGNREDAEDVSQEVFIKVYKSIKKFRGDSKLSTWLYKITMNTCYSLKSKKSYTEMKTKENIEELVDAAAEKNIPHNADPERAAESGFIQKSLDAALLKLSKNEKIVFVLRNFNELSFGEIVDMLNMKPSTVRSLNFRALKKLRREMAYFNSENL